MSVPWYDLWLHLPVLIILTVLVLILIHPRSHVKAGLRPRCGHCGYDLTGAPENRCSECGRLFIVAGVLLGPDTRRQAMIGAILAVPIVLDGAITTLVGVPFGGASCYALPFLLVAGPALLMAGKQAKARHAAGPSCVACGHRLIDSPGQLISDSTLSSTNKCPRCNRLFIDAGVIPGHPGRIPDFMMKIGIAMILMTLAMFLGIIFSILRGPA